jgi:hypothetical protein
MPGKQVDLSGKSVYYLEQDQFEKLFCRYCKEGKSCPKTQQSIHSCMGLVDSGVWDATFRKREEGCEQ